MNSGQSCISAKSAKKKKPKAELRENVNKIQIKSGSRKEELSFVELHKVSSQDARKNANTDFIVSKS